MKDFFNKILALPLIQKRPYLIQFVKFSIVGFIGAIIDFGLFAIFTRIFHIYYLYSTAISVVAAITNNFILNKYWVFKRGQSGKTKQEYINYFIISSFTYFLNLTITYSVVEFTSSELLFGHYEDFFAKVVANAIVLFINFFAYKFWTFKK
jgi:putative flippase GtrA